MWVSPETGNLNPLCPKSSPRFPSRVPCFVSGSGNSILPGVWAKTWASLTPLSSIPSIPSDPHANPGDPPQTISKRAVANSSCHPFSPLTPAIACQLPSPLPLLPLLPILHRTAQVPPVTPVSSCGSTLSPTSRRVKPSFYQGPPAGAWGGG